MENKINASSILNSLPLMFEKNIGQYDKQVKFVLRQNGCTTFFTESEVVLELMKEKESEDKSEFVDDKITRPNKRLEPREYELNVLRIRLENSNKEPKVVGEGEFKCKINYLKGRNKEDWTTDIPIYEKVVYKEIYPGIDLVYYGNQGILEHDFIVSPGSNLSNIKVNFEGTDNIELDEYGNILISVNDNTVQILKPRVYQEIDKKQIDILSNFIIEDSGKVSFKVENYDESKVLIIDPQLMYGTYLGGNFYNYGTAIAVDTNENAYITGYVYSTTAFPITENAYQSTFQGSWDAFLIKINTRASTGLENLLYGSYLGGNNYDVGYGIAVDTNENAYITGYTYSTTGFPITSNAYQGTSQGEEDSFLIKINTKASTGLESLLYGTYLGGNYRDIGYGIAVDASENAYITGYTVSRSGFPITSNAYQSTNQGGTNAFLIKINTKASTGPESLLYGTYLGGNSYDQGYGIAVDTNENAYITGYAYSATGFPITSNAYQSTNQGVNDAFLIKINTKANTGLESLLYGTYLGGNDNDVAYGIAVDTNENAYITGDTRSITGFPITSNAYQSALQGGYIDAFLIKINTRSSTGLESLLYGSYLGGNDNDDYGYGVAVDETENAYITGRTRSTSGFPITSNAYQSTNPTEYGAFLIKINTKASTGPTSLLYGTYLGGNSSDEGYGIAVDTNENAYITGHTESTSGFPITSNAYQNTNRGAINAFIIKLNESLIIMNKSVSSNYSDTNSTLTYTIGVNNNGLYTLNNINFIDTIPNNTVMIPNSLTLDGTAISGSTNYPGITIPSIGLGATSTIQFSVIVDSTIPSPNYITNSALAIYTSTIENTTIAFNSNVVTTTILNANLNNTFVYTDVQYATCGDTITYSISLYNLGNITAENIFIMDTIPNGISFISNSVVVNGTTLPGSNPFLGMTLPNIGAGVISTVSFKVKIDC